MSDESAERAERDYVPAAPQLWLYDFLVALLTRESLWRRALLIQIDPKAEDRIADIGCGTGTLLALIGRTARPGVLIGIDPDQAILERARRKLAKVGVRAELQIGYARDTVTLLDGRRINKIVSSLM